MPRLVTIDCDGSACCPVHGAQPGAEYAPGTAPCGCTWYATRRGVVYAVASGTPPGAVQHLLAQKTCIVNEKHAT